MFLNDVKRFVSLLFLVLLTIFLQTVSAQQNDRRDVSFSERQSKTLGDNPPASSVFEKTENLNFEDLAQSSLTFCLRADSLIIREEKYKSKISGDLTAPNNSTQCDSDLKSKTSFSVASPSKEFRDQKLLPEDCEKNPNIVSQPNISNKKSFQHFRSNFRSDVYPNRRLNLKSFSFNQPEESESEKDKPINYSRSQSPNSLDKGAPDDQTADKTETGFRWRSAIGQSLMFLAVQHGYALTQAKTRRELKGNFFNDYVKSVKSLRGWEDGGRFFTNYIAHPMQGSFTGFIQIQNDPKGLKQRFGGSADYWRSRAKALAWTAAWSTQFEIGPLSQASIGNVGLKGKQTYVDLVMTPLGGTAMIIGEDAIDRFVMKSIERRTNNFYAVILSRMLLSPTRTVANLFRFKTPWYRDRPRAR